MNYATLNHNSKSNNSLDNRSKGRQGSEVDPARRLSRRIPKGWSYRIASLSAPLWLALSMVACGDDASSPQPQGSPTQGTSAPNPSDVAKASHVACTASPLVRTWRMYTPTSDVITIGSNCSFQSYTCGDIGYIDSDVTPSLGIATIVIVYEGNPHAGCPGSGAHSCAYDARDSTDSEIHLSCR